MQSLNINNQEQSSIAQYIKEHDTAVLTVMFTDIQGFTEITEEKGDQLATELRSKHDKILTDIIQKNNAGLVIKFIGDAVMAVFAEPSAAIDKSIQIQNAIEEFNQQENDLPSIKIRIGLHMGQVTVEENVQIDVFGRHVNRAARIESLAQGGQILMSYSVFDSAQGWFVAQKNIASVEHGLYQLKGIKGSVQIFEVYDPRATKPVTPSKGKITTKSTKTKLVTGILSAIVTVLIVFTLQWYQAVELRLESFYPENMRLAVSNKLGNKTAMKTGLKYRIIMVLGLWAGLESVNKVIRSARRHQKIISVFPITARDEALLLCLGSPTISKSSGISSRPSSTITVAPLSSELNILALTSPSGM